MTSNEGARCDDGPFYKERVSFCVYPRYNNGREPTNVSRQQQIGRPDRLRTGYENLSGNELRRAEEDLESI